jgi:DNA-directed RNA polymerase subunit RPC12/RpoP
MGYPTKWTNTDIQDFKNRIKELESSLDEGGSGNHPAFSEDILPPPVVYVMVISEWDCSNCNSSNATTGDVQNTIVTCTECGSRFRAIV